MAKDSSDNIYTLLLGIKDDIGQLKACNVQFKEDMSWQNGKLHTIEAQTIRTNGRVTKLEDFTTTQLQINSRIEGLYKASQENLKLQLDNIEDGTKRQIDEFKKDDVEIIKIDKENGGKIRLAIISTASTIAVLIVTWLLTKK